MTIYDNGWVDGPFFSGVSVGAQISIILRLDRFQFCAGTVETLPCLYGTQRRKAPAPSVAFRAAANAFRWPLKEGVEGRCSFVEDGFSFQEMSVM